MEYVLRTPIGHIKVEGVTQADLFEQLYAAQEVFSEDACGQCGGTHLKFRVRTNQGNKFYEMVCQNLDCRAVLSFGQSKVEKGRLFPVRKIVMDGPKKGRPHSKLGKPDYEHRGWVRWNRGEEPTDEVE